MGARSSRAPRCTGLIETRKPDLLRRRPGRGQRVCGSQLLAVIPVHLGARDERTAILREIEHTLHHQFRGIARVLIVHPHAEDVADLATSAAEQCIRRGNGEGIPSLNVILHKKCLLFLSGAACTAPVCCLSRPAPYWPAFFWTPRKSIAAAPKSMRALTSIPSISKPCFVSMYTPCCPSR